MQRTVQLRRVANAHLSRPLRAIRPLPHRPRVLQSRLAGLSGVPRALPLLLRTFHLHEAAARGLHSARLVSRPIISIRGPNPDPLQRRSPPALLMRRHFHYACIYVCMYTNFIATSCMQSLFRCCFPLSTLRLSAATGNDGAELSRMLHFPARQEMLLAVSLSLPLPSPKQKTDSILKELFIGGKSYSWPVAHSSWPDAILMYATFHLPPTVLCRCHKGCPRLRGGSLPALTCVLSVLCCARCTADSQWRVNHI